MDSFYGRFMGNNATGQDNYNSSIKLERRKVFNRDYVKPVVIMKHEIARALDLKGSESVLDVACGFGDFLGCIKENKHMGRLVGVDISQGMIDQAIKTIPSVEFFVGNAEELSYKNEFDVVVCKHALYHFNNIQLAVDRMYDSLKSGGTLVISLNSLEHESRAHIEKYKILLSRLLNVSFVDNNHRINMENYHPYFYKFELIKEFKFFGYATLTDGGIFTDYMDTIKEFYYPLPSDTAWNEALNSVKSDIEQEIKEKGYFREVMGSGLALFIKK